MSINRNKTEDKKNTEQVIFGNAAPSKGIGQKNWLDHSGACEKIDEMLIEGANMNQLLTSGRRPNSVRSHIQHLQSTHGLPISSVSGVYKFDFSHPTNSAKEAPIRTVPRKKQYLEPTVGDFKAAAQLLSEQTNKKEISFDVIFDYLEQDFCKKGQQLNLSWRRHIEDEINKNRGS